jgi:hypothetical protein
VSSTHNIGDERFEGLFIGCANQRLGCQMEDHLGPKFGDYVADVSPISYVSDTVAGESILGAGDHEQRRVRRRI